MWKKRIHKNFRLFFCASFLGLLPLTSCCETIVETRKSFSFQDNSIDLLVGNSLEVNVNASKDINLLQDIKYTFNGEDELTLENTATGLKITGNKEGSYLVNASYVDDEKIISSLLVNVNSESVTYEYKLNLDTSATKVKYLKGEEFSSKGLKVYASLYENGVEIPDYKFYLENYTLNFDEGQKLDEIGEFDVTINCDPYGTTSYKINVSESLNEISYAIDTANMSTTYKRGQIFSTYGLKVYKVNTLYSLDDSNNIVTSSDKEEVTSFNTSIVNGTKLDTDGIIEVGVSGEGFNEKFKIIVYEDDTTIKDVANKYINTKNIGLKVQSTIATKTDYLGFNKLITYKPNYVDIKEYKKESREDFSSSEVSKESGMIKDANDNSFTYEIIDNKVTPLDLIKQDTTNIWDDLMYGDITTFKAFNIKDFPTITLKNDAHYYIEEFEVGSINETTISTYPLLEAAFKLANMDTSLYEFVSSFEINVENELISIKVNVKNFGYFEISTIPQAENLDVDLVIKATKEGEFTFKTTVDPNVTSIIDLMKLNNYTFDTGNGIIQYYNENYVYTHYDPIYILAGLSSIGYLKVDHPIGSLTKTGIYSFTANEDSGEIIIDETSLKLVYEDTNIVSYSSLFTSLVPGFLTSEFESIIGNDLSLATFSIIEGTTNALLSNNADVSEAFMNFFFGEGESDNRTNAINYGYINGAMLSGVDENGDRFINLMCVNKSLYGYSKTLNKVGSTYIDSIEQIIK